MAKEDDLYFGIGSAIGGLSAAVAFFASWWYCAATYGYLLGFGLGWLPSAILAVIVFFALRALWGLVALFAAYLAYQAFFEESSPSMQSVAEDAAQYSSPQSASTSDWSDARVAEDRQNNAPSPQIRGPNNSDTEAMKAARAAAKDAMDAAADASRDAEADTAELEDSAPYE